MILLRRIFSENDEKKNDKIKTAGKIAAGTGAAAGIASYGGQMAMINKISDNAAKKYGVTKLTPGVFFGVGAQDAAKKADRALKMNKNFRRLGRLGKVGTGVALTGASVIGAKKLYDHFNKKEK